MMDMWDIRNGQTLMMDGRPVRVENKKIKKITVIEETGKRWDVYPYHLSPAPEGTTFTLRVEVATVGLGTVFRFKDGRNPGMHVCIGMGNGTFKATKLFNESGNRYFSNIHPTTVDVVTPEELKAHLSYILA